MIRHTLAPCTSVARYNRTACTTDDSLCTPVALLTEGPLFFPFLVKGMASAETAVLLKFQFVRSGLLVFGGRVVLLLTRGTDQCDNISHSSSSDFS